MSWFEAVDTCCERSLSIEILIAFIQLDYIIQALRCNKEYLPFFLYKEILLFLYEILKDMKLLPIDTAKPRR